MELATLTALSERGRRKGDAEREERMGELTASTGHGSCKAQCYGVLHDMHIFHTEHT